MDGDSGFSTFVWCVIIGSTVIQIVRWLLHERAIGMIPDVNLSPGDRVGWLVDCSSRPAYTHIRALRGNTVIQANADWGLRERLMAAVSRRIGEAGWHGVDLAAHGIKSAGLADLVTIELGRWVVNDGQLLKQLREDLGLKLVILARQSDVAVVERSDEHGTWIGRANESGLTFHVGSLFDRGESHAVLACTWHIIWLDEPCDLLQQHAIDRILKWPIQEMSAITPSADGLEALSSGDLARVEENLHALIETTAATAIGWLRGQSRTSVHPSDGANADAVQPVTEH